MVAGWVSAALPPGATDASKKVKLQPGGAIEFERMSTYGDGQVIDDHVDVIETSSGTTTIKCRYERRHYVTAQVGPSVATKGSAKIVDGGSHLTWSLSFTDTNGKVTQQSAATALNPDGSGVQSVTTIYPDGSGVQEHIQWTDAKSASRRTETSDSNDDTTNVDTSTVSSTDGGAWQAVGSPVPLGNDATLDELPPPYGPHGPVIGGDVVSVVDKSSPAAT